MTETVDFYASHAPAKFLADLGKFTSPQKPHRPKDGAHYEREQKPETPMNARQLEWDRVYREARAEGKSDSEARTQAAQASNAVALA